MFCTSRPAGPVIGVKALGRGERGEVRGGAAEGTSPFSPLPRTSARSVGITGSSASLPLSNCWRQSSPTDAGSRRYCSYITCTKAALWVPNTNSLTRGNVISRRRPAISALACIFCAMKRLALLAALVAGAAGRAVAQDGTSVPAQLRARIARAPAQAVGLYYRSLARPDSVLIGANLRFHAASTMKVPVMIQIFRDADAGLLTLDDSLVVHATFPSLVDGSPFDVDKADDSDSTLYLRLGGKASVRELLELMITRSSNLATNLLIERVGAERAQRTARFLGAWSIQVLRGVEDGKAYRAGLNNTTTARDLGVLLAAIAQGRAASPASCDEMLAILGRQEFNEGIPAALRPGLAWPTRRGGSARSC